MGNTSRVFTEHLAQSHPDYRRFQYQTYLTAPEWRNVEMATEMANFLNTGQPLYRFPYFAQIFTLWKVFFQSMKAARQHHSLRDILFSEYTLMNMFICGFTSVGFFAKGCVSLLLWPVLPRSNQTAFQGKVAEMMQEYAQFIHKTPFFNYPYRQTLKTLWSQFKASPNKSIADYVTFCISSVELLSRSIIAAPIAYWYNQPQNQETDRLHLVVKSKRHSKTLSDANHNIVVHENKRKHKNGKYSYYTHVSVPRYEAFQPAVRELLSKQAQIINIAGCKQLQCKVIAKDNAKPEQMHVLYHYKNSISNEVTSMIDVDVKKLGETLEQCEQQSLHVKYLHDF